MLDNRLPIAFAMAALLLPPALLADQKLTATDLKVGRNLQLGAFIKLAEAAPAGGLQITITSDDPTKMLLAPAPDKAGSPSIVVKVNPGWTGTANFFVQALADSGQATYTASLQDVAPAKGTVTFAPSSIVLLGPAAHFLSTPRGYTRKMRVVSAMIDAAGKIAQEQVVAGGTQVAVEVKNPHPEAGRLGDDHLVIHGGQSVAETVFIPAAVGSTTFTPIQPKGFTASTEMNSVVVDVEIPKLTIATESYIGKDLQSASNISLGELAPPGGLKVTLKSSDPSKLRISDKPDQLGGDTLTIDIPEGQFNGKYYLQALSGSGEVTYTATAPGFASREGRMLLTSSAVIIGLEAYGPPDEAAVYRPDHPSPDRKFHASVAAGPVNLGLWTAFLAPNSGRAADVTVQPLRGGLTLTVPVKISNPEVGKVDSPVIIGPGSAKQRAAFTPLSPGQTIISVDTPEGFTQSKNAASAPADVGK